MGKITKGERAYVEVQRFIVFDSLFDTFVLKRLARRKNYFRKRTDLFFTKGHDDNSYNQSCLRAIMRDTFLVQMSKLDKHPTPGHMIPEHLQKAFMTAAEKYGLDLPPSVTDTPSVTGINA